MRTDPFTTDECEQLSRVARNCATQIGRADDDGYVWTNCSAAARLADGRIVSVDVRIVPPEDVDRPLDDIGLLGNCECGFQHPNEHPENHE